MEKSKIVLWGVVLLIIVGVLFYLNKPNASDAYPELDNNAFGKSESSGEVLAGNSGAMYKEFNQADYEQALSENKKILLYFYATWCPICVAEQPAIKGTFDELDNENIIGFRVNYKDSATDNYEKSLAEEFGITYQHTKVIIVNGEQSLKSLENWDKDKYIEELNK